MFFKHKKTSEHKILDGLKKGNQKYERILYQEYSVPLFQICLQYASNINDAEDLLQDSFIKIYESISQFESRFEGGLVMWMRRIVINTAVNHYRENKKKPITQEIKDEITEENEEDFLMEEKNYSHTQILEAITELPQGYRLVFNLYVLEGKKHQEIADQLSISVNTSKSQLSKARKKLISLLSQKTVA
ncbi:MAG: sigma-70 family RNA polymerase sigma factor [Bacteroidales bacterium]|nr:sigma-70 family RNA polymerase sigma factor [Bacteroidales bacterium]